MYSIILEAIRLASLYLAGNCNTALTLLNKSKLMCALISSSKVSNAMIRLLYAICRSNENEAINFLIEEQGIDILKYIFEKVLREFIT